MSVPVVPGYLESGDSTERNEDTTQNKIPRDPSDTCAEERQAAEQNKVACSSVHSRPLGRNPNPRAHESPYSR